jgi:hypothetical protein
MFARAVELVTQTVEETRRVDKYADTEDAGCKDVLSSEGCVYGDPGSRSDY